jgi:hypothetical protein
MQVAQAYGIPPMVPGMIPVVSRYITSRFCWTIWLFFYSDTYWDKKFKIISHKFWGVVSSLQWI